MSTLPADRLTDRPRYVLLVEDSSRDAELALMALAEVRRTNEIVRVYDGVEVLEYLHRRGTFSGGSTLQPALILLDLKMPRLGGIETLRRIKADPRLQPIPVVVMSSSREEKDLVESYRLGVNAYIVKPMKFRQYIEAVKQVAAFWIDRNESPDLARLEQPVPSAT